MAKPDVIVVGAGVVGCSIAYHLGLLGAKVTVFDKAGVCEGMTSRSGALIRMHYTFAPEAALAWKSLDYFANWDERVGGDCRFVKTGFAIVVGPSNADRLRENVGMLQALGINTRIIEAEELTKIEPEIESRDAALAAYEPDSGYADPTATTLSLAQASRRAGVTFTVGTRVSKIVVSRTRAVGIRENSGSTIEAGAVCIVAGPWTDPLLAPLGQSIGLKAERAQISYFERSPQHRHCGLIDMITGAYFRPQGTNLTLAGLGAWKNEPPVNPDSFKETNDSDFIAEVRQRLGRRFPKLGGAPYRRGHAGVYDVSPDSRAVMGAVPGIDRLFVAAGFSGTGFKTAPAVGAAMADIVLRGKSSIDISAFGFERLISGNLITPEHEYDAPPGFGHRL
jgi:sarcosine oxidase subunit beta